MSRPRMAAALLLVGVAPWMTPQRQGLQVPSWHGPCRPR